MSGPPGNPYHPEARAPDPSGNAYPPPMNYPMPNSAYPPPNQPGFRPPGTVPPNYGTPGAIPPQGIPPPPYSAGPPSGVGGPPGGAYPPPTGVPYGAPPAGFAGGYPGGNFGYPPPHQPGFIHSTGNDSDDSQPGDPGLRSKGSTKRIKCTFLNHADTKVVLYTIDEKGKMHKVAKMKDGKKEVIDTFEGNIFLARSKKRKLRGRSLVINNNILYAVTAEDGDNDRVKAEILRGPDCPEDLQSEKNSIDNVAVKVKFINRSKKTAQLVWINHRGKREKQKAIAPGKCYTTTSYECHYWIAHDVQNPDDELYLNYAFFYSPWKTKKKKERVLITQSKPWRDSSSSSSSD